MFRGEWRNTIKAVAGGGRQGRCILRPVVHRPCNSPSDLSLVTLDLPLPSPASYPFVDSRLATCSWTRAGRPTRPANWFQLFPDHVTCRGFYMDNWLLLLFRYPARDSAGFIAEDRRLSPSDAPPRRGRDFRYRASSNSGSLASDSFRPRAVRQLLLRHPSCTSRAVWRRRK